jgi:hypothetical protein
MWRMCVLTVLCETDSSFAISGMDRLVGRQRYERLRLDDLGADRIKTDAV